MTKQLPADLKLDGRYKMCETAKILDMSYPNLWRWVKAGKIKVSGHYRTNGRPFIKGREIVRAYNNYD